MTWPFKKKEQKHEHLHEQSDKAAELMGRIREGIKAGGFAIIGVSDGSEPGCLSAATIVNKMTKGQVMFSVAKSLGMSETEVVVAMAQYSQSKVMYPSPIQKGDLK